MVIIPDLLSEIIRKGEVIDRYYNPGELFREVHLVLTNADKPDWGPVQKMVGGATLYLHNIPLPSFRRTLGWHPWFLGHWARTAVDLARRVCPQVIRCYGVQLNVFLASEIKREVGTPLVVSVHCTPDFDRKNTVPICGSARLKQIWMQRMDAFHERRGIRHMDVNIAVYASIQHYFERYGASLSSIRLIYNSVNQNILKKERYESDGPFKLITVGNQVPNFKSQVNIVKAVGMLENVRLFVYGNGVLHDELVRLGRSLKLGDRITFETSISNDVLARTLKDHDAYIYNCLIPGISKSVIEAQLAGLPVIHNRRPFAEPDSEVEGQAHVLLVEDQPEDYAAAIAKLMQNQGLRENLGNAGHAFARTRFDPEQLELAVIQIYRELIGKA